MKFNIPFKPIPGYNIVIPRALLGTSPFIAAGQFGKRSLTYYVKFLLTKGNIQDIVTKCLEMGITGIQLVSYPSVAREIYEAVKVTQIKPIIVGTRITVRCIAGYYQMGMSTDEILTTLGHLTPSQLHSALAYYFDHQVEVDSDLAESSDVEFWKSQVKPSSNLKSLNS